MKTFPTDIISNKLPPDRNSCLPVASVSVGVTSLSTMLRLGDDDFIPVLKSQSNHIPMIMLNNRRLHRIAVSLGHDQSLNITYSETENLRKIEPDEKNADN